MAKGKGPRVLVALATGLCLLVAGAAGAAAWLWDDPPDILAKPTQEGSAEVTHVDFTDPQTVSLAATMGPQSTLVSPASGVVSSMSCALGGTSTSGQSLFAVNGVPVVSLATTTPMWRDIVVGMQGADVVAVASELSRLGVFSGDAYAAATLALTNAFADLAVSLGAARVDIPGWTIPLSMVAWLPAPSVGVASCDVPKAAQVTTGQVVAHFASTLVTARITTDLSGFLAGDRVLTVNDVPIAANQDGTITDADSLSTLATTPAIVYAMDPSSLNSIQGKWTLATPVPVSVVPAAAIRPSSGSACVLGDGNPLRVSVVSSQIGSSYVTFTGTPPARVDLYPPNDLAC
ncbi:MAG: hypothetical protein LBN10_11110 [Propionibacteriaceae bacterium]|jgi:hypothetical protein|nr:hypothetical protein [Propionibacteriaceae bacterium]